MKLIPRIMRRKRHVGVVGLYGSGKTVFLTSLINHLKNHRPEQLSLGKKQAKITFGGELRIGKNIPRFPYQQYRSELVEELKWPTKTKAVSQYRCWYYRSDWRAHCGEVTLTDFPGERLADVHMAGFKRYDDWSDWIESHVLRDKQYRPHAKAFLGLLDVEGIEEVRLIGAYRDALSTFYREHLPIISPSTLLLREDGKFLGAKVLNKQYDDAFVGLDEERQFVPLPDEFRRRNAELARTFSARYTEYRKRIALPLVKWMRNCDSLLFLIDVTTLLACNVGMYNSNGIVLDRLLKDLKPGLGPFGLPLHAASKVVSLGHGRFTRVHRIGFVATKSDKVREIDRDALKSLAEDFAQDIVGRYAEQWGHLDVNYFSCAAVRSTASQKEDGKLQGRLKKGGDVMAYMPSEVPKRWPDTWKEGQYCFPDVLPYMPENHSYPPNHLNLNEIVVYVM